MAEFNPYGQVAIHIPLAVLMYDGATETRKSLSMGAKVLYGRLALFLGKPKEDSESFCCPSLETLAHEMGTSEDTVSRWRSELVNHDFIKLKRRGRGQSWEIVFLEHPCFSPAAKRGPDTAKLRRQSERSTPQNCSSDTADCPERHRSSAVLTPQNCGFPYKEENIHENSHPQHHQVSTEDHDSADEGGADDFLETKLLENLLGLFIALGRGCTVGDRVRCENLWKGLASRDERHRAHDYAMAQRQEWQSRPTSKIPQPWSYLEGKYWEREAPRLLLQRRVPTRAESQHSAAAKKFMEAGQ